MYSDFEEILKAKDISAYSVAKNLNMSQGILSSWKAGNSTPNTRNLKKIADYLDVPLSSLMSEFNTTKKADDFDARVIGLASHICSREDLQELVEVATNMPAERLKAYLTFMKNLK